MGSILMLVWRKGCGVTREIKFRAWDKKDRVIREVYGVMFKRISNKGNRGEDMVEMHCSDYEGSRAIILSHFERPASEVELMQFTGLLDKNGKEVYEGDILRIPAKDEYEKTTYNSFEVFWHDNDATPTDCGLVLGRLKPHGNSAGGYSGYKLIPRDVSKMEVIGNIYENPELVKELV